MKNLYTKTALVLSGSLASATIFAADHTASITAAQTDASLNVTAVATAVIAVVAILFGINLIKGMISK
jgi:hypothetical protein